MATYIGSDGYVRTRYENVPGQPHIKYNGTYYIVTRSVMRDGKTTSQYKGGITSLPQAIKVRDAFVEARPAETMAEYNVRTKKGKGEVNTKELQKASRWFYKRGEVSSPNYLDLKGAQLKKVYDNVTGGTTPGTFSKTTIFTPLLKSQQNKILKAFPEADFDLWKKGFDATTDSQRFAAVDDFIKRGYKPAFHNVKQLPKKTQDFLIEAFGKEAKAAGTPLEFGPGRKLGITVRENTQLATRINNFLNNVGKTYPYAFSFDRPANWMIAQMHRASKHNNDYKVFKNDAGKIIGASEKGVKYYHVNSGKGKLITSHPEAAQIAKFVDLAKKSRANIPQSLLKIFPKGFDQKLLNSNRAYTDLLRWLDNTQGRRVVANAINIHHAGEGAVVGSPALARDLQLLVASDNLAAASIKKAIETKDFSRVPELKEKGIRLNVGGVEYGAGPETVEAGLKRIEKGALPKLQAQLKIDPKLSSLAKFLKQDVVGFSTTNNNLCSIPSIVQQKAAGGRIGFATGTGCAREMEIAINKNPLKVTQEIAELPANKTINTFKNAAKGFLGALGRFGPKVGKYGAIAAAGAIAQPLVKQFRNDDTSTWLTDPEQQAGMLDALIEGERPKPRSEILDWTHTGATVGATAAAVPGTSALYKARRLPTLKREAMGPLRAGTIGPAMKLLSGMFTPAGLLATEPLRIAQKRREGESWGEIGTDPMTWMGPAFAPSMTRMATRGMNPASLLPKLLRLGMSRAALAAMGPVGWVGLAASLGWEGTKQYQDYKKGRGFFAED
jgi:hypothetical protein